MISPGLQASFNSFMDGWMFGLFVSSQCILRSKLLFTSSKVARQVQVVLVAVSFKKSCIIKILLTIEALERDGIYPVHVSFVFSQALIGYKCLVALVTHVFSQCSWTFSFKACGVLGMGGFHVIFISLFVKESFRAFSAGEGFLIFTVKPFVVRVHVTCTNLISTGRAGDLYCRSH